MTLCDRMDKQLSGHWRIIGRNLLCLPLNSNEWQRQQRRHTVVHPGCPCTRCAMPIALDSGVLHVTPVGSHWTLPMRNVFRSACSPLLDQLYTDTYVSFGYTQAVCCLHPGRVLLYCAVSGCASMVLALRICGSVPKKKRSGWYQ